MHQEAIDEFSSNTCGAKKITGAGSTQLRSSVDLRLATYGLATYGIVFEVFRDGSEN